MALFSRHWGDSQMPTPVSPPSRGMSHSPGRCNYPESNPLRFSCFAVSTATDVRYSERREARNDRIYVMAL